MKRAMDMRRLAKWCCLTIFLGMLFAGCAVSSSPRGTLTPSSTISVEEAITFTATNTRPIPTSGFSSTNTPTPVPSSTPTPTPEYTKTLEPTATYIYYEKGNLSLPILLYHHIEQNGNDSRYYVSPTQFASQMDWLAQRGYHTITIAQSLDVLIRGGELPPKPIVITFDDGHESVYQNAFPIMREYGFRGVFYIVANRLGVDNFVDENELSELINAGWEIGSHSMTHADLTADHSIARREILDSRLKLEDLLGIKVVSFAYPYGKVDPYLATKVQDYGYIGAVGLGPSKTHTWGSIFYLNRIEIYGSDTLDDFRMKVEGGD